MKHLRFLLLSIMTFMIAVTATAQNNITVTGTVVDKSGEPIIGASVIQKGTSNGAITDLDGNFSFTAPEGSKIVFSYVGFASQELTAAPGHEGETA